MNADYFRDHPHEGARRESTEYSSYSDTLLPYSTGSTQEQGTMHSARKLVSFEAEHEPHVEHRLPPHKYLVRRPRALQFRYKDRVVKVSSHEGGAEGCHAAVGEEGIVEHREKLDLFVDLIWVGIISNLTTVFYSIMFNAEGANPGGATLLFVFVFMPSWRIWNFLREFVNNYYHDDMVQRIFLFWIFCLSMFYGQSVAFVADYGGEVKKWIIGSYLVIRGSFLIKELIYCFYIPWLRKLTFVQTLISVPAVGFWIAAIQTRPPYIVIPVAAAIVWEYVVTLLVHTPLGKHLVPSAYTKAHDSHHLAHRMSNFFIITIGEGVLLLIKDGPLGIGLTEASPVGVWALLIYFLLVLLYFNGDSSKTYISAVAKDGWRSALWLFFHVPLFAAFLPLSAAFLFCIAAVAKGEGPQLVKSDPLSRELTEKYHVYAERIVAYAISVMLFCLTGIALTNKSLDPPGTLLINNRYIRLFPRMIAIACGIIILHTHEISSVVYLGLMSLFLLLVYVWEWVVSLERDGQFMEPKGVTALLKMEIKDSKETKNPSF